MPTRGDVPVRPDTARYAPVPRAFPQRMEILTEHGFYDFADLDNADLFEEEVAHEVLTSTTRRATGPQPAFWLHMLNDDFPRVATVHPETGEVSYVRPSLFRIFEYGDRLVQLKMKGVDVAATEHAEYWLKARYGRSWRFVPGSSVFRNRQVEGAYYFLNDKFNQSLYGEYSPLRGLQAALDRPIQLFPMRHTRRTPTATFVGRTHATGAGSLPLVYNVDVEPWHTIIVRKGRADANPRTPWVGNPVIAGDGSDKSQARINQIRALADGTD